MASSDRASGSRSSSSIASSSKSRVLCYSIEAVSDDLIDCRLQIIPSTGTKPQWYKERSLNELDEIVDKLIDARTGRIVWTSHRPDRGWYLHLQLPSLPREEAVPLVPAKSTQAGCTPLSLTIGTRIDHSALSRVDHLISQPWTENNLVQAQTPSGDSQFTAVSLDQAEEIPPPKATSHARTSSRTFDQGHARRRSARMSASTPTSRHVSRSSQVETLPESQDQDGSEDGKIQGTEIERPRLPLLEISSQPQLCHLLLADDPAARNPHELDTWSGWAWKNVPVSLRAPLSLNSSSKAFSLLWRNAPLSSQGESTVEVIRYEDDAGWWNWKGKRRGRILIQEEAVKALRLDLGFWIAVTLAYLEFLEERDGYHASSDG